MRRAHYILLLFPLLLASACSPFNKVSKSEDPEKKYVAAKEYYAKKDYGHAAVLLDDLIIRFKGDKRFEEVYYYYAYSKYGIGELTMAAYHFKNFYESFPASEKAEESLYMYAYCEYLESNPYYLDQSYSKRASETLQLFINLYPYSKYVVECNKYIDELRAKMRKKSLETARLYYKVQDYRAATVAFKNVLKDYPEVEQKEEIEFLILRSSYLLAQNSIEDKRLARYEAVVENYNEYSDSFKQGSPYYKDALSYFEKASASLIILKKKN